MQRVDVPPRESEQVLEALQDAGLLAHRAVGHEYGFAQPMVQQAVVEVLRRKPWAKRVHRALLEVLSESDRADEDALFLADGFLELGDEGAAKTWLGRAVQYGLVTGLFRQAAECAERLVGLASDEESRGAARLSQVDALLRAGETSAARAVLEPAMATLTGAQAVRARIFVTAMDAVTAGDVEDPTLIEDADAHGELGVEARVAAAKHVRGTAGLVLIDEAVDLLDDDTVGDLAYRVLVLRGELLAEVHGIEHPSCREAVQQTKRLAQSLGSAWASLDAQNDWALMEAAAGNERDAIRMMAQVAAKAESQHFGTLRRGALVNLATLQLRAGRPQAAAVAAAEAAAEAQRAGDTRHAGFALSVGADALKRLGKLDEARLAIDEAVAISTRVGDGRLAQALLRRADILTELGDSVAAFADLEAALEEARRRGGATYVARARLRLALARVDRDDDGARQLLSELVAEIGAAEIGGHGPLRRLLDVARERMTTP
jgi:tetratricopeptide (TPR) repeat protein